MHIPQTGKTQYQKVLLILFISLFVVLTYTFLHEGGHALVGILSGERLTAFSFIDLNAHVSLDGSLSPSQAVLSNISGVTLPLLAWLVFILLAPRQSNLAIECLKIFASAFVLSTLLAWIALPVQFIYGKAPLSDDVTNFLRNSGLPPLLVSFLALAIFLSGWALLYRRIPGLRSELALIRKPDQELMSSAVWKASGVMAALLLGFTAVGWAANGFRIAAPGRAPGFLPPSGYALIKTIDLSEKEYAGEAIYRFNLEKTGTAGVYLLIQNINSPYFEVILSGPGGYKKLLVHAEGYTAIQDNPHMEERLQAGEYQVILTSKASPGELQVYLYRPGLSAAPPNLTPAAAVTLRER